MKTPARLDVGDKGSFVMDATRPRKFHAKKLCHLASNEDLVIGDILQSIVIAPNTESLTLEPIIAQDQP